MGLFTRKNPYEKDAMDLEAAMRDTPERPQRPSQAMQASPVAHSRENAPAVPQQAAVPPPAVQAPKAIYGIEDAIRLMRELPDNKKEMVITIVQKTLISAKINVSSIIDDATRKIDRLEKKNDKLGHEIRELEEAIAQRKSEMERNARDVEETREVKLSFESTNPRQLEETQARYAPQAPAYQPSHHASHQPHPHHNPGHRDRDQPMSHSGQRLREPDRDQPVSQSPLYIPSQKAG